MAGNVCGLFDERGGERCEIGGSLTIAIEVDGQQLGLLFLEAVSQ